MAYGPTGFILRGDFEQQIDYDQQLEMKIKRRGYYWDGTQWLTTFYHYFKAGVEVGYWCALTESGFIFETPRVWHPDFMCLALDERADTHGILTRAGHRNVTPSCGIIDS